MLLSMKAMEDEMATCKACGLDVGMLRGGRCKTCDKLYRAAKTNDLQAAQDYADRGGTDLPGVVGQQAQLNEAVSAIEVTTETFVPHVVERLGVVTGQCALGMNIFRDFTAEIRDLVGGRSGAYQKAIKEAKDKCIADMKVEAAELGAEAVIAMDLDFNEITGGGGLFGGKGMIMVVATGTAVKLAKG